MSLESLQFRDTKINRIAFGTWGISGDWGNSFTSEQIGRLIKLAVERGVNLIDTAPVYGLGHMETEIGDLNLPSEVLLSTKIPAKEKPQEIDLKTFDHYYDPVYIRQRIDESSKRLKRNIDIILLHNWHSSWNVAPDYFLQPLLEEKRKGNVRFIGVSLPNNYNDSIATLVNTGVDVIQTPYNPQEAWAAELVFPHADQVLVIARSLFAQGVLSQKPSDKLTSLRPDDLRSKKYGDKKIELDNLYTASNQDQVTPSDTLLQIAHRYPHILLLVGMTTESQVIENTSLL